MSHTRTLRAALAILTLVVGCADDPVTPGPRDLAAGPADLDLVWPRIDPGALTPSELVELESAPRPAGVLGDAPDEDDGPPESMATIFGAATNVGFTATYAYSAGRHSYIGNVGKVSTEARVTFDGQVIGVQPAERQNYTAFLLDWGDVSSIWAEAYVFTDQQCGLRVSGNSQHQAWWQWFLGGPAPTWGLATVSSQAFPPAEQPPCEEDLMDEEYGGSGGPGGSEGGSGDGAVTCWYWVTYDPYTGEIYDADFLYCDDVEGG